MLAEKLLRRCPGLYQAYRRRIERVSRLAPDDLAKFQSASIERILRAARRCTDVYGAADCFSQLPILTKSAVRSNERAYVKDTIVPIVRKQTGGTTGQALTVYRSIYNVVFEQAMIDWLVQQAGFDFSKARVAVLRGNDVKPMSNEDPPFWHPTQGGRQLVFSANHLNRRTYPHYLGALRTHRPDILYAYPSSANLLARLADEAGDHIRIPLILTSSEMLHEEVKRRIERTFQGHLVDYYGQAERVCFAYSLEGNEYRFHPAYGFTELLFDSAIASEGVHAFKIIGTGYENLFQPLLRYNTGDYVEICDADPTILTSIQNGFRKFSGLAGRLNEVLYGPSGQVLIGLNHLPKGLDGVQQLQLIQTTLDHVIVKVLATCTPSDNLVEAVRQRVRTKVPNEIDVEIKIVDELEKTRSGKAFFVAHRFSTCVDRS